MHVCVCALTCQVLDSDGKVMVDRHGSKATRDIVQYVKVSPGPTSSGVSLRACRRVLS